MLFDFFEKISICLGRQFQSPCAREGRIIYDSLLQICANPLKLCGQPPVRPPLHGISMTTLPTHLETAITRQMESYCPKSADPTPLIAKSVADLSTFYIENPNTNTPYEKPWAQIASIAYYLPLNTLRAIAVLQHAVHLGFMHGVKTVCDVGSGLGAISFAAQNLGIRLERLECVEKSLWATDTHRRMLGWAGGGSSGFADHRWSVMTGTAAERLGTSVDLITMSYSLTEFLTLPTWLQKIENLLIIEPGTKEDSRALMEHRNTLIKMGFYIWAPCTHQLTCPLLIHSARDWCHDRIEWQQPRWYQNIEAQLPMQNRTLPFSYLLASKRRPPTSLQGLGRTVGDRQDEKGRSKQLICRDQRREFIVWQHRHGSAPNLGRGSLLTLSAGAKVAGDGLHPLPGEWAVAQLGSGV